MLITPRPYNQYIRRSEIGAAVDWTHPAASSLQALWIFGLARNPRAGFAEELTRLVNPALTLTAAGNGSVIDTDGAASRYASVSQTGSSASNNITLQTGVASSGNLSFACYVMRSSDTDTSASSNVNFVQELATTENSSGSQAGWELNLGNAFGAAGDKNKPRIGGTSGIGATNAWLNGIKQSSTNPFDTALTNGVWYGISGTIATAPAGNGNLTFYGTVPGGTSQFGFDGGLAIFALYNVILPDAIMADLSLNPFSVLGFPDDMMENPVFPMPAVTTTVFRKTFSQIGGRVGSRQQIGWGS